MADKCWWIKKDLFGTTSNVDPLNKKEETSKPAENSDLDMKKKHKNGQEKMYGGQKRSKYQGQAKYKWKEWQLPSCWKSSPKCVINITESLEWSKSYAYLIKEGGILEDPQEIKKVEKKIVSVFMVNKHMCKIFHSTKNIVVKSLESLGVKPQRIIKGLGFPCGTYCYPCPKTA